MRIPRIRLTVFRTLLVVAIVAILLQLATDPLRSRARERLERCLQNAATHSSAAADYRKNAQGDPVMLNLAAWHEHMRREFERAAQDPDLPVPPSPPCPPRGWVAPEDPVEPR